MRRGQVRLFVAVVLAATLAACSSNADPSPTSTEPLVPSGSVVESSGIPVSSSAGPTPSVVDPSTVVSTAAGGLTVAPLPADLTADQVADARAAIEVYRQYWALSDESARDPNRDWTIQIGEIAIGSAAETFSRDLSYLNSSGLHTVGATSVQASVAKVEPALVHVTGCIDVSATDVLDASGNSVGAPDGSGVNSRFTTTAQVGRFQSGQWLVTVDTFDRNQTC